MDMIAGRYNPLTTPPTAVAKAGLPVPLWCDQYGRLVVSPQSNTLLTGQKLVTTHGTRVPLVAVATPVDAVLVRALPTNTGKVFVGPVAVTAGNGYILSAGDAVSIPVSDLALIYIDSAVDGEGVCYLAT